MNQAESQYTNGTAAFVNVVETEKFNGQDTGKYSIVLALDEDEAQKLVEAGIKLKDYQGTPQRKFTSKFPIKIVDSDGAQMSPQELTWGSKVRLKWKAGRPHPVHGVAPYLNAVKVLELAEMASDEDDEF